MPLWFSSAVRLLLVVCQRVWSANPQVAQLGTDAGCHGGEEQQAALQWSRRHGGLASHTKAVANDPATAGCKNIGDWRSTDVLYRSPCTMTPEYQKKKTVIHVKGQVRLSPSSCEVSPCVVATMHLALSSPVIRRCATMSLLPTLREYGWIKAHTCTE